MSQLDLPPSMRTQVQHLWSLIKPHEDVWQGKKPMGVAAALIYKTANESGSPRTQSDRALYKEHMQKILLNYKNLEVIADPVIKFLFNENIKKLSD